MKRILLAWLVIGTLLMAVGIARGQCGPGGCPTGMYPTGGQSWMPSRPQGGGAITVGVPPGTIQEPNAPEADAATEAVVKMRAWLPNGQHELFTGTVIRRDKVARRAYIVTCWHFLRDRPTFIAAEIGGKRYQCTVVKSSETWDLCILRLTDPGVMPAKIARQRVVIGQRLVCGGFGPGRRVFRWVRGIARAILRPNTFHQHVGLYEISGTVRDGDSGGPIIDDSTKQIVGVISAADESGTYGTCGDNFFVFVEQALPATAATTPPDEPGAGVAPTPPAAGPSQPAAGDLTALAARIEALESTAATKADFEALRKTILAVVKTPGPPGKDGRPGLPGPAGKDGQDGKDADTRPWYLRTINPATGEENVTEIFPGDTVTLKLFEYPKPKPE